jgi:hypothetical protein
MPLFFFFSPVFFLLPADTDRLDVESDPAIVDVVRQGDGRQLISLPALEFPLRVTAYCGGGGELQSVSISVADTRQTIRGDEYPANDTFATTLSVSPQQLAPIAVEAFCTVDYPAGESRLLKKALTAQVSLRCALEDSQSVVFAAEPLDVILVCTDAEPAETE